MKLTKLFLLGAVALGFVACNKNKSDVMPTSEATMSVRISQAGTRAIGTDQLAAQESAIKSLEVYVFNSNQLDGYGTATGTAITEVKNIAVTTGARTIIVVANANLGKITSKSELEGKVAEKLTQELDHGLAMTSDMTANTATIKAGSNFYGYTAGTKTGNQISEDKPIELTRVAARVALLEVTSNFTDAYAGWTFEPEQVFLFNANAKSKYFGSSLVNKDKFFSGIDLSSYSGELKADNNEQNNGVAQSIASFSEFTSAHPLYFYTYENDADKSTVLTIKGKLKNGSNPVTKTDLPGAVDDQGYTYYSVVVNAQRTGYTFTGSSVDHDGTIKRNTQYNISLTIKHPGTDDPTKNPVESATLDVNVKVLAWVVVGQNVAY